jgi:hypothetical protein
MANGADASHRVDRGRTTQPGVGAPFSEEQRIWLLERDLDVQDKDMEEIRLEMKTLRKTVTTRLNWLVGLGFAMLMSVVSVLVTVIASQG